MKAKNYTTNLSAELTNYFNNSSEPSNFNQLQVSLKTKCNKTTLYRQLARLVESNFLTVFKAENNQIWEKTQVHKHTHLECQKCNKVVCVDINPELIKSYIQSQTTNNNFFEANLINSINLKGLCSNCK